VTTIAKQVRQMNETMAAQPPNEVMGAFDREQADLAAQPAPEGVVEVGDTLADFELLDPNGSGTSLYQALGGRVSVLVFYRGRGVRSATLP
jgi:hypothetical protein